MSLVKKLVGETAIYGIGHIVSRVLFFVVLTPYLTNKLKDTGEYGIYSDIYSYGTLLLTLLIFRLDTALFRYGRDGAMGKALGTALVPIAVLIAAALGLTWLKAGDLATYLGYPESAHYVKWMVYIMCFDALTAIIYAKLRLESRPYRFLIFRLGNVLLTIVLIILFFEILPRYNPSLLTDIREQLGMTRLVDYVFFANLIASASVFLGMLTEFFSIKLQWDKGLMKKMLWYALPLVVVGLAGSINQTFSTPLQKVFLGADFKSNMADAGIYAAAAKLAILLSLFTTAFNYAAEPFFFNNEKNKDNKLVYGQVALVYTIVACLGTLGIVGFLDIVILIIGENYREGARVVPFLLFAYVFLGLYYNVSIWYKLKDKTNIGAMISLIGMVITVVFSILFLPRIGTIASAYGALICYIVMVVICYIIGQRYFAVDYPVLKILGYIAVTALLVFLYTILREQLPALAYYGLVVSSIVLYLLAAWKLDVRRALKV